MQQLQETGLIPGLERSHSSILVWRLQCTEEPGGTIRRAAKGQTWLKQLSTHARRYLLQVES